MPALLALEPSHAAKLGVAESVASEIAWSIRRGERWETIRGLAEGSHSYQSPPEEHSRFARFREVAAAILEVDPERDAERGLAAFVAMRIATSLWHLGRDQDQRLVVDTFRQAARNLGGIQRSRLLLSDANPLLPESAVEDSIANAQHYALSDDDVFHKFYDRSIRTGCGATRTNGIGHQCLACEMFRRCMDRSSPSHTIIHNQEKLADLLDKPQFRSICEQTVDPMTGFYANAIAGATLAMVHQPQRARTHLKAALRLRAACDTPSFLAFALYWSVVVDQESPWAIARLDEALRALATGAQNLCVMPVPRLRADIEGLRDRIITGRPTSPLEDLR